MPKIYGIYKISGFEEYNILCTDLSGENEPKFLHGLAFDLKGKLKTAVLLKLENRTVEEIGYVYVYNQNFALRLDKISWLFKRISPVENNKEESLL